MTDLVERIEAAEGPSRELFREIFDRVFPEPPKARALSFRWLVPTRERVEWERAESHFYRLCGQRKWNELALWLLGLPENYSLTIIRDALRAKGTDNAG